MFKKKNLTYIVHADQLNVTLYLHEKLLSLNCLPLLFYHTYNLFGEKGIFLYKTQSDWTTHKQRLTSYPL